MDENYDRFSNEKQSTSRREINASAVKE